MGVDINDAELVPWRNADDGVAAPLHQHDDAIPPDKAQHQGRLVSLEHTDDSTAPQRPEATELAPPDRASGRALLRPPQAHASVLLLSRLEKLDGLLPRPDH